MGQKPDWNRLKKEHKKTIRTSALRQCFKRFYSNGNKKEQGIVIKRRYFYDEKNSMPVH